jgi:hypothetical protein
MATHAFGGENHWYNGVCDASAAVALDNEHFVMADNNTNKLFVYAFDGKNDNDDNSTEHKMIPAEQAIPLEDYLHAEENKEADIEAGAKIGSRIWWITSHGRKKDLTRDKRRYRLFATDLTHDTPPFAFEVVGTPYRDLIADVLADSRYKAEGLVEAEPKGPEADGINIEGLAEGPGVASISACEARSARTAP